MTNTTKHTHPANFGRKEANCPRCDELLKGAEPVQWRTKPKSDREMGFTHKCDNSCGTVCTWGEW